MGRPVRDELPPADPVERIARLELEVHLGRGAEVRIRDLRDDLHGSDRPHHPQPSRSAGPINI